MTQRIRTEQELVNALDQLPRQIAPETDPWPAIEQNLRDRPAAATQTGQGRWPLRALAASVAVAFVAGILFGRQTAVIEQPDAPAASAGLAMKVALEATEREYQAAFREFIPVGTSRVALESQAIANIEASWLELQQAESALLAALREYPDNEYLNQKLLDLRAQQLGFMKQLATLDQSSWRKT